MIAFIAKPQFLFLLEGMSGSHELIGDTNDINQIVGRLKNATHYSHIVIDIGMFTNSPNDIANSLFLLNSTNNTPLIVIAQGYCVGDELLSELVANGVYNFILSFDIADAMSEMQTALKGVDLDDVRHFINVDQLGERSLFRFKKASLKTVTVGIAGVCGRIGTTTQAMRLARYLLDSGFTTCCCEQNESGHIELIKNVYSSAKYRGGYIDYRDLHIYYKSKPSPSAYNYIIYDFGTDLTKLATCDLKLVVAGCTAWEMMALSSAFPFLGDINSIFYIFSFTSKSEYDDILDFMENRWNSTYFAEYSPDMFADISSSEKELYGKIISVKQGQGKKVVEAPKKSGLFKKVARA